MKNKKFYVLFIAVFLAACMFPSLGMVIFGESEAAANEILAQRPSLTTPEGGFNGSFTDEATDYVADRFAGRQQFITAYAKLQAALFQESASEKVVLGKDGWLFFADTMDDYLHRDVLSSREIAGICRTLEMMQEYAGGRGAFEEGEDAYGLTFRKKNRYGRALITMLEKRAGSAASSDSEE